MSAPATAGAELDLPWEDQGGTIGLVVGTCETCRHLFFPPQTYGCERCGADGTALGRRTVASRATVEALVRIPRPDGEDGIAEARLAESGVLVQVPVAPAVTVGDVVAARWRGGRVELAAVGAV